MESTDLITQGKSSRILNVYCSSSDFICNPIQFQFVITVEVLLMNGLVIAGAGSWCEAIDMKIIFFILMQIKLIFTIKVLQLASF